jgi:hypothetical protein
MEKIYYKKLNFKEDNLVYLISDNKVNKDKIYKVHNLEYVEGGSYFDGFEIYLYAYLEDIETNIIEKIHVAYFSPMQRITIIYATNIENFK